MPRNPTASARNARRGLLDLAAAAPHDTPLPTTRELGNTFGIHASTAFRLLRDLAEEGIIWQSPAGRFFPAAARGLRMQGAPVCFLGREMWQWSQLYREILEGISEVCSANGSPLVFLSTPELVRQDDPLSPPQFASASRQKTAIARLLPAVPGNCAGLLLDHLWKDSALSLCGFPAGRRVQLLRGTGNHAEVVAPDFKEGARLARQWLDEQGATKATLIVPFEGDPAIDASMDAVREELEDFALEQIPFADLSATLKKWHRAAPSHKSFLLCLEDNTAGAAFRLSQPYNTSVFLLAMQGTSAPGPPIDRLRYDYRRLGQSAAAHLIHGTAPAALAPTLLTGIALS